MKKINFSVKAVLGLLLSLIAVSGICAQEQTDNAQAAVDKSKFYVVQIPIEKIYPHKKGYVINYRANNPMILRTMYLPATWFDRKLAPPDGPLKGEMHLIGAGKVWPHVSLFYIDGVLDHVKVFARKEQPHSTWGNYIDDNTPGVDENFDNVENIILQLKNTDSE
ncbi:hypothetical protein FACS1894102_6270 [Spirochaetia bacterium]|nr:hypothetical protein FACS1894102_6270 [Spirochaetia bacterium]